jgi:hypothetical protein
MRFRWTATRVLLGAAAAAALLLGLGGPAQAYPGSADDRMFSTPTSWWTYQGVSAAQVADTLSQNNARPTDLRVLSTSPLTFSVTEVSNTGAYASGYWWYYGVTLAQVNGYLSANNARLISAVRYGNVYAVVMVPNTGANAKAWGWCDTTYAGISACLGTTNRLTNIERYADDRFVVIFVQNSENYGWCWYVGISRAGLDNFCGGQSILDISANPDGTFNVASVAQSPADGRPYSAASPAAIVNFALLQPPDRPLFITPYVENGSTLWITSLRHN